MAVMILIFNDLIHILQRSYKHVKFCKTFVVNPPFMYGTVSLEIVVM